MPETDATKANLLRQFFSNPVVGVIGSIASVIGLILAIYFYIQPSHYRDLVYLVHPAKAIIFKNGLLSRISMSLDGKTLSADVTAAQIALWNAGNDAIRKEHVLQPFTLVTTPQARIIEATIRKISREAVRVDLDTSRIDHGELGVSWNIFEKGDGAIVQIIFAGPPNTPISAKAVIEGQRALRKIEPRVSEADSSKYGRRNKILGIFISVYIVFGVILISLGLWMWRMRRAHREPCDAYRFGIGFYRLGITFQRLGIAYQRLGFPLAAISFAFGIICSAIIIVFFGLEPEPPFGF